VYKMLSNDGRSFCYRRWLKFPVEISATSSGEQYGTETHC